jgi:hypothetical protein
MAILSQLAAGIEMALVDEQGGVATIARWDDSDRV